MKTRRKTVEREEVLVQYQLGEGARKVPAGQGQGKILEMWVPIETVLGPKGHRFVTIVHGHGDASDLPVE